VLERRKVHRLGNVREEPEPEDRFNRLTLRASARRNDGDRVAVLPELRQHRQGIEGLHLGLEDDQVGPALGERAQGLRGRARGDDVVPTPVLKPLEALLKAWQLSTVIVEDEHAF